MSSNVDFDGETPKRTEGAPYSSHHPIPTVKKYQEEKEEREAIANSQTTDTSQNNASPRSVKSSKRKSLLSSAKGLLRTGSMRSVSRGSGQKDVEPYKTENRNFENSSSQIDGSAEEKAPSTQNEGSSATDYSNSTDQVEPPKESVENTKPSTPDQPQKPENDRFHAPDPQLNGDDRKEAGQEADKKPMEDTSEAIDGGLDAREKRKQMKHMDRDEVGREVTDPVTHLRTHIHDSTAQELDNVPGQSQLLDFLHVPTRLARHFTPTFFYIKCCSEDLLYFNFVHSKARTDRIRV